MKLVGFICCIFFFLSCEDMNQPIVIGHRGAMGHETENTIASINKAIELDVDMIEIDVFLIKSGEIVVFHDDDLERLTNATGSIESKTYTELQSIVLEGGHTIPLLTDVLNAMDNKAKLNIELKGARTTKDVDLIIKNYIQEKGWKLDDFLISSFKWDELKAMRAINATIAIAVLTEEEPAAAIPIAKELNAVAINPDFAMLTAENNLKIKEAGFKIYPWTVNEPHDILAMKKFGVDGIITNYPERMR